MYAGGNPVNRIDPTGLFWKEVLEFCGVEADETAATVADVATGFVPVAGEVADVAELAMDIKKGDTTGAVISAVALVVPFGGAKLFKKIVGHTADAAKAGKRAAKSADEVAEETTDLYRAVKPDELKDIQNSNKFRNPEGIESKYFSSTEEGAEKYGKMAEQSFGDPPYTTVKTTIPTKEIDSNMKVDVDRGIPAIVVPTKKLHLLSPPKTK